MIDLKEYKVALGSLVEQLSEKQIFELRDNQDQMAEIFFAMWLNDAKKKKNELQYNHGKGYSKELSNILPSELSKTSPTG